jgi:hypothetical protein
MPREKSSRGQIMEADVSEALHIVFAYSSGYRLAR